jgi:hypothetical protein
MRTTLNRDDDVAAQLAAEARKRGESLSRTANEYLRAGLRSSREAVAVTPYEPPVFDSGRPLLDVTDTTTTIHEPASGSARHPKRAGSVSDGASTCAATRLRAARAEIERIEDPPASAASRLAADRRPLPARRPDPRAPAWLSLLPAE